MEAAFAEAPAPLALSRQGRLFLSLPPPRRLLPKIPGDGREGVGVRKSGGEPKSIATERARL